MSGIRVTWEESNIGEDGFKVYRDISPMDPEALPTEIADLPPNSVVYEDTDVDPGTTYYYRIAAYKGVIQAVSSEVSAAVPSGDSLLPPLTDENATFNDEGDSTTGWTFSLANSSVSASWLRITKNTASSGNAKMVKAVTLAGTNKDFIVYGKVRTKSGAGNEAGVMWMYDGTKIFALWLNYDAASGSPGTVAGRVSIQGYNGGVTSAVAASGLNLEADGLEFALQYDHKWQTMNCFFKESDGTWSLRARVSHAWFSTPDIEFLSVSNAPSGWWLEIDYLTVCRPNFVVIGDSIAEGKTLYSPNRSLGLSNYSSHWARYFNGYASLRNNLIVNKGVGSETSTATLARIADATSIGAKVIFLHASTNDYVGSVSDATRTSNITSMVSNATSNGAETVLLNAMYGTSTYVDNPSHRNYMLNWWDTSKDSVGAFSAINIMTPIISSGYMADALTQSDKIHPTPSGYQAIGEYLTVQ